ncbi:MAG: pantetheine-phosphate adenylyltransferase [Bordetella sp.]|nr:MAG: pantetheine-phosphate adenylyltransferase [Bordetella sp.]
MTIAIYPGTFDPLTRGHEDLIYRASKLFDTIIVGIAYGRKKKPFFSIEERIKLAKEILIPYKNVRIEGFYNLLKDFVIKHKAKIIIRGLRAMSDFEYEFQMAGMNKYLLPNVETIFMTPSEQQYQFISGSIVREISSLGGEVSDFVHPAVQKLLRKKNNLDIK